MKNPMHATPTTVPVMIKEGSLFKKGAGGGLLHRSNWKRRYFKLTENELLYFDPTDGRLKGALNLSACGHGSLEIQPKDCTKTGTSASSGVWRFALRTPSRRLVLAAKTEDDMTAWIQALQAVLDANEVKSTHIQQRMPSTL
ncbi:hypothetical protein DYB36_002040 [Aphanomyces astaci]|uniref:PH domain-containing protein n=1 Tax=Aphanomyces astaci TaxID=112090 RepID=A0A397A2X5_APHAT|nr:hypothetical protein DYB36_002040 [Aphanomyces astaci]